MPSYRLPGFSEVKRNDVVVFNYPIELQYPKDLKTNIYQKSHWYPWNVIEIKDTQVYVNGEKGENPAEMQFNYIVDTKEALSRSFWSKYDITSVYPLSRGGFSVSTTPETAEKLKAEKFINSVELDLSIEGMIDTQVYPNSTQFAWNVDNFGPLEVPAEGQTIQLTPDNLIKYGPVIKNYEGLEDVRTEGDQLFINGEKVTEYTFKQNYYFMMGDNRHDSLDSRYWGFVPEDHIVGKALFIWLSIDPNESFFSKIRWSRIFSGIK